MSPHGVRRFVGNGPQPIECHRLFQKIERPLLHRFDGFWYGSMARDHNHIGIRQRLLGATQNFHAVDIVHDQVGNHDIV